MPEVIRNIPGVGKLVFEEHAAGSLKPDGEVRTRDYRAYKLDGKRLPSVTTLLGAVLPAPGLIRWAEAQGARGASILAAKNRLPLFPEDAIHAVRREGLGADAAKQKGADRGLNLHDLLRDYMETGSVPNPANHSSAHAPFIRALCRWLIDRQPEPKSVEQIVCHPELKFAGRMDLRAVIDGEDLVVDLKSQAKGSIFSKGVVQVAAYALADERCGSPPADGTLVVAVDEKGRYHELPGVANAQTVETAIAFYEALKPVDVSVNNHWKKVR